MGKPGFFYDTARCTGCGACQVACKEKNQLPVGDFCRRVDTVCVNGEAGEKWMHFSGACNHCENAACMEVCPTGAMYRAEDGTVQHRDDLCIGCGRCVHNCPYGAPTLNRYTGYAQKCDACAERRAAGRQPACVEACPMRALHFGDVEELERQFGAGHGASQPFLPPEEATNPGLLVRGAERRKGAYNPVKTPAEAERIADCKLHIVILGGGAAAISAAKEIRRRSETASVTIISREKRLPYCRPMLSKGLLNSFAMDRYPIVEEVWLQENDVTYLSGVEITKLDPVGHTVTLADGREIRYDKCIYALGADCFVPPIPGRELPGVYTLRNDTDLHGLRRHLLTARSAVVIGGGITGLELAWEMKKAGLSVTVLDALDQLMGRILDGRSAALLRSAVENAGIRVETGVRIREIAGSGRVEQVVLEDGNAYPADVVVLSTGYRANTALAEQAGLTVEKDVMVSDTMATSDPDIYACGDCAGSASATWLQSVHQGEIAAANALGIETHYTVQAEPAMVHTANTSLMAAGDLGKQPDKDYTFLYGTLAGPAGRFRVNPRHKNREDAQFAFCFAEGKLTGAALVGDLSPMLWVQEAVDGHWDEQKLRGDAKERGVELYGE